MGRGMMMRKRREATGVKMSLISQTAVNLFFSLFYLIKLHRAGRSMEKNLIVLN